MNCKEAKAFIYGLLDGEPENEDRKGLDAHLAGCRPCAEEYAGIRKVLESTRKIPVPDPGEGYWSDFLQRLSAKIEEKGPGKKKAFFLRFRFLAAASAALLFIILAVAFRPSLLPVPPDITRQGEPVEDLFIKNDADAEMAQAFLEPGDVYFDMASNGAGTDLLEYIDNDMTELYNPEELEYEEWIDALTQEEKDALLEEIRNDLG